MSTKIKELAEQAGDDWDHTLEEDKEFLKKFAELIAHIRSGSVCRRYPSKGE